MKNTLKKTAIVIIIIYAVAMISCQKDKPDRPVPVLTTSAISSFTQSAVITGGNITDDKGYEVTSRGVCWGTNANPTISNNKTSAGTGAGIFECSISGLSGNTEYHVRAYAKNAAGTGYGNDITFTLDINKPGPQVTDIEGNVYNSVVIGDQIWMKENLKTTKYNNGESIPLETDNTVWSTLATSGYCWYNNDEAANKNTYGALYNWYAAFSDKICPTGWHVPTDGEFITLSDFLEGYEFAGGKLKEEGTTNWNSPNTGATNESGFGALPGGYRDRTVLFYYSGSYGRWWSASPFDSESGWGRGLGYNVSNLSVYGYIRTIGFSVRCVKD